MTLLPNTKKVIYLNAGHWDDPDTPHFDDPGAVVLPVKEGEENIRIRDLVAPLLEDAGFEVHKIPDDLNLRKSIDWVNERAKDLNDGLAFTIHNNFAWNKKKRGTEAYYGSSATSRFMASIIAREVAAKLRIPNRGAHSETETRFGELGWIRQPVCWSALVECIYVSNDKDVEALHAEGAYQRTAEGIVDAIKEIFGMVEKKPRPTLKQLTEKISSLKIVIVLLKQIIELWKKKLTLKVNNR